MFRGVRLAVRCVLQDASCTEPPNPRLRIGASFVEQDYCVRMDAVAEMQEEIKRVLESSPFVIDVLVNRRKVAGSGA
jgi:hypothetical protein